MNTIDFVQHKPFKYTITTAAYLFQKKGKFRDWVFNKLFKRGWFVPYKYEEIKCTKHTLHLDDMTELVNEQRRTVYELQGKAPTRMIIGNKQWSSLISSVGGDLFLRHFSFQPFSQTNEYMGMTVEIVPWMDGVILLP